MRPFVAIDFETANEQRRSACSIGLVRFDGTGRAVEHLHRLIRPHPEVSWFNPVNVSIHRITAERVADGPEWDEVAEEAAAFIGEHPLVAHNMGFDGSVLNGLTELYGLAAWPNPRLCTLRLARRVLADALPTKGLTVVHEHYFPGEVFEHHDACADARAAGRIFARMQEEHGYEALAELCPTRSGRTGTRVSTAAAGGMLDEQLTAAQLIERYGGSDAIAGDRVAITGTLRHGRRADIQELVTALGGIPEKSLTRRTTILIVGIPNPGTWSAGSSASRKLDKAAKLRESGVPVEVLTEEEFFHRLGD
ncbi:exonuclease domain-containing protein [Corynebacterium sphenisci]|uniref:exonuclease domain-containing protein n=1 Tax=Corynebacterium sphenisci TaxID=191493 RepID=UPI0026E0E83A|nr:exonuclease domain-containing protein [Corynebacterium sphenisci]MDO5730674.1 exonuclease domain-containing protein [Corynebacterium sphenisci]